MTRHRLFNPDDLPPASGFSYGALSDTGRLLHIAGITGHGSDGSIDVDLIDQFGEACAGVARVITEAGGSPSDLVSLMIYTTDVGTYRARPKELGIAYRDVFGRHYPPMALLGVSELFDPRALVELVGVAVVPEEAVG